MQIDGRSGKHLKAAWAYAGASDWLMKANGSHGSNCICVLATDCKEDGCGDSARQEEAEPPQ